eukprot:COSAG03_NODE_6383_length_1069_cov_0.571134_3_plen_122_part_00
MRDRREFSSDLLGEVWALSVYSDAAILYSEPMGIGGTLYKSVCRAARFCDANPALRRHVLARLVREAIYIDDIPCRESAGRRLNDESFSMVQTVSAHFRQVAVCVCVCVCVCVYVSLALSV